MNRLLRFNGKRYGVDRIYNSGTGETFSIVEKQADGKEIVTLLSEESTIKDPSLLPMYEACQNLFRARSTLGKVLSREKHIISSSITDEN
jgi:hypothetical protein